MYTSIAHLYSSAEEMNAKLRLIAPPPHSLNDTQPRFRDESSSNQPSHLSIAVLLQPTIFDRDLNQ